MYAILFIPDASYLYGWVSGQTTFRYLALYSREEAIEDDITYFEIAKFKTLEEAKKRFDLDFYKKSGVGMSCGVVFFENSAYHLYKEIDKVYFEIVEIK